MTRKEVDDLIRIHEAHRNYAKAYLDQHYFALEEQDKETEWINRYVYHKQFVEKLKKEKADDD